MKYKNYGRAVRHIFNALYNSQTVYYWHTQPVISTTNCIHLLNQRKRNIRNLINSPKHLKWTPKRTNIMLSITTQWHVDFNYIQYTHPH